jgi:hypothetical protein
MAPLFLTSALDGGSSQLHAPAALPQGKAPGNHWILGWMGPRAGLDAVEKRKILNSRYPSLCRLSYPCSS